MQSNLHLSKKLERIPLRRGHTSLQPLFRSPTTLTFQCSRLVKARRQPQSNMSKQMELAPLRRGHLILQQAQLKKEAGRPQAASVRVGSAAGQLLQLSQNRWKSPINNQLCRLQARPRTIWITQRTRWLSPPAHCEVAVATLPVPTLAIQPAPAAVPPVVRVDPITRYHQFRPVDQLAFHMRHINIDMMAVELPHVSAI